MESLALLAVALAIVYHAMKGNSMADFTRLNAAIAALAAPLAAIASRLQELSVDSEDQEQVNEDADQLEAIASQLGELADGGTAEHVDDTGDAGGSDESLGGEPVSENVLDDSATAGGPTVGDLVTQAPSEDTPGDVDHVPAEEAPTATTGDPERPEADDTSGQSSGNE